MDAAAEVRPGQPLEGDCRHHLRVNRGVVDMTLVWQSSEPTAKDVCASLGDVDITAVPLLALCIALDAAGRRAFWLWAQIAFQLS